MVSSNIFFIFLVWIKYKSKGAVYKYTFAQTKTYTNTKCLIWEGTLCHDGSMAMVSSNIFFIFFYFFLVWIKSKSKGAVYKYTVAHTKTNTKIEHLKWEGTPCHDGSMPLVSSNLQYHDFHHSLKCQIENEISDNTIVVHSGRISDVAVLKLKLLWYFPLLFLPAGHYWKINWGS